MIIVSDNQATNILIDFLGMENINLIDAYSTDAELKQYDISFQDFA